MTALKIVGILVVAIVGVIVIVFDFTAMGTHPDKETQLKLEKSPNYDKENHIFLNRRPNLIKEMRAKAFSFAVFKEWFSKGVDRSPDVMLPQIKPDLKEFLTPAKDIKVIWFGHSTFLINFDGKILLIDPVFSISAAPSKYMVKRFQEPVLKLEELPPIDYVVISHDHYDHLDMYAMKFFANTTVKFLTPLGVGSHLIGWGVPADRITELDWWQNHNVEGMEFIATPAQHFSGRNGVHENMTLWASWVIRNANHNIYFSGDSGYDTHFKTIGDKYGPFDLAFIENGQYNEKWREVHVLPDQATQAFFDLRAKRFFPVHWGMFVLAFHTWYEPIAKQYKASQEMGFKLISPMLGQIVTVNDDYKNEPWWEKVVAQEKAK